MVIRTGPDSFGNAVRFDDSFCARSAFKAFLTSVEAETLQTWLFHTGSVAAAFKIKSTMFNLNEKLFIVPHLHFHSHNFANLPPLILIFPIFLKKPVQKVFGLNLYESVLNAWFYSHGKKITCLFFG